MDKVTRPPVAVLPDAAAVPDGNRIVPPPNQFTHEVAADQAYFFGKPRKKTADGVFPAGTKVVLLVHDGGAVCRVADGTGLYVATDFRGLKKL